MLTDEQKKNLRAAAAEKLAGETKAQRAREAYEDALTKAIYAMTVANREAHFHPQDGEEPAPLLQPDDIRELAIEALRSHGVIDPDAPAEKPKAKGTTAGAAGTAAKASEPQIAQMSADDANSNATTEINS
jgi:hypothetical protein